MASASSTNVADTDSRSDISADIAAYEDLYGVDEASATAELADLPSIAKLQVSLSESMPDTFGGLWIDHSPYGVSVAIKGKADQEALGQAVEASGLQLVPQVKQVDWSYGDLQKIADQVLGLDLEADVNIDIRSNRVVVNTTDAARVTEILDKNVTSPGALVTYQVPELSSPVTNIYGGMGGTSAWNPCESAFDVKERVGGPDDFIYGFLSAGHCGTSFDYLGVSLPLVATCFHFGCDSQWHTPASYVPQPSFYYDPAHDLRFVTAAITWSTIVVGGTACHYGLTTGYECGTVESRSAAPSYVPHAHLEFIKVGNNCASNMSWEGDSGGPNFYGTTAYGITSGKETDIDCLSHTKMIFGAMDLAISAYSGVSLMFH